jgi:hypothetical protein
MKKPIINIDRNWTRLVWFTKRLRRRPIFTNNRPKVALKRKTQGGRQTRRRSARSGRAEIST